MQTFEELVEMYMKCDKKTLAELLALRDLPTQKPVINEPYQPQPYTFPQYPLDYWPWWKTWYTTTTDNVTGDAKVN